jgi:hypothetical protein
MKMNNILDSNLLFSLNSSPEKPLYLSNESSTHGENLTYSQYTDSNIKVYSSDSQVRTTVGYPPLFHRLHGQDQTLSWQSNEIPVLSLERGVGFDYSGIKASNNFSTLRERLIPLSDEIIIVPLREPSFEEAKLEIIEYLRDAEGRKVYISELAEKLRLDIELIMQIMDELGKG